VALIRLARSCLNSTTWLNRSDDGYDKCSITPVSKRISGFLVFDDDRRPLSKASRNPARNMHSDCGSYVAHNDVVVVDVRHNAVVDESTANVVADKPRLRIGFRQSLPSVRKAHPSSDRPGNPGGVAIGMMMPPFFGFFVGSSWSHCFLSFLLQAGRTPRN